MCEMLEESLLSGMNVNNNGLESGVEESTYGNHLEDTFWDVSGSCCQTASGILMHADVNAQVDIGVIN